jgi:hypothetical protein
MGTNFQWRKIPIDTENGITWKSNDLFNEEGEKVSKMYEDENPIIHIGKRSAAGLYEGKNF